MEIRNREVKTKLIKSCENHTKLNTLITIQTFLKNPQQKELLKTLLEAMPPVNSHSRFDFLTSNYGSNFVRWYIESLDDAQREMTIKLITKPSDAPDDHVYSYHGTYGEPLAQECRFVRWYIEDLNNAQRNTFEELKKICGEIHSGSFSDGCFYDFRKYRPSSLFSNRERYNFVHWYIEELNDEQRGKVSEKLPTYLKSDIGEHSKFSLFKNLKPTSNQFTEFVDKSTKLQSRAWIPRCLEYMARYNKSKIGKLDCDSINFFLEIILEKEKQRSWSTSPTDKTCYEFCEIFRILVQHFPEMGRKLMAENSLQRVMGNTPSNRRDLILERVAIFSKKFANPQQLIALIVTINDIADANWDDTFKAVLHHFSGNDVDPIYVAASLRAAMIMPPSHNYTEAFKFICNLDKTIALRFVTTFWILPFEHFMDFANVLQNFKNMHNNETSFQRLIAHPSAFRFVFSQNPKLKENIYKSWSKTLSETESTQNKRLIRRLSYTIVKYFDFMGLHEQHPLYTQAIATQTLFQNPSDPKNPFNIYKKLQEQSKVKVDCIVPFKQSIHNKAYRVVSQYFRQMSNFGIKASDLPTYDKKDLKKLVESFEQRLSSEEEKDAVEEAVKSQTGMTYTMLKQGSLGSDYLQNLLDIEYHRDNTVLETAAQFIAIVHWLNSLSNDRHEVDVLSERESRFLAVLTQIQKCRTGKGQGVSVFYNRLPENYKLNLSKKVGNNAHGISEAPSVLITILRSTIADMLNGATGNSANFYTSLLGDPRWTNQGVHQVLFVKNLIGRDIGLSHSLTFDVGTATLYPKLVEILQNGKKEVILNQYYALFTPYYLANAVSAKINSSITIPGGTYFNDIENFIGEHMSFQEVWETRDQETYTIRPQAVLYLLTKLGALEEVSHPHPDMML